MTAKAYEKIKGLAMVCTPEGTIEQILRNDFEISNDYLIQKLFANLTDQGTRQKALNFIIEIKNKHIAFDYQLNFFINNQIKTLYFIGLQLGSKLLLIGADNHKEAFEFTNHLQNLNNEQANLIRQLLKSKYSPQFNLKETEKHFDEISHLNNELVNLQRQLTKKNVELEKLNELKNKFLGIAAHDLRNPLGNLINYAEFLEYSDNLSDDQYDFVDNIKKLSLSMLTLVNDLLDVSAIESGKITLKRKECNLADVILDCVNLQNHLAAKKNIQIFMDFSIAQAIIDIDREKISQVLTNLITNAIKYSHPDTNIQITLEQKKLFYVVGVIDEGQGIAKDELGKLFVPFQVTSTRATAGEKSTGLGLFIVKRIIEAHEGEIWAKSEPGKGSAFYFKLPYIK